MDSDKGKFNITESDEDIKKLSKEKFKTLVRKKVEEHAIKYLNDRAKGHSKSEKITNYDFKKKAYLTDRRFSKEDVQTLFALRTKMVDCKNNFQNQYQEDLTCRICKDVGSSEDEDHILACKVLNEEIYNV